MVGYFVSPLPITSPTDLPQNKGLGSGTSLALSRVGNRTDVVNDSEFAVSVVMECEQIQHRSWIVPRWRLVGVVAGQHIADQNPGATVVHDDDGRRQLLWTGFRIRLYRDSAESYWYNLVGRNPSLFLICRQGPEGELEPFLVTANYDEAGAHMEADDQVFSAPMPPEIRDWLERYVMDHYRPEAPKKRKRKNWTEEAASAQAPGPDRTRH